jgi:hypothetical protein
MSIGSVALNDPMINFFKAVETARLRNVSAFDNVKPAAKFEIPAQAKIQKTASRFSVNQQSKNEMTIANTAPTGALQSPKKLQTKMLGNFFDAYA